MTYFPSLDEREDRVFHKGSNESRLPRVEAERHVFELRCGEEAESFQATVLSGWESVSYCGKGVLCNSKPFE